MLKRVPADKLKLTKHDDEIYEALLESFPEYKDKEKVKKINEEEMKSAKGKEAWRKFMTKFEKTIKDYNFGTLLRLDSDGEYDQHGTMFALRLQFYAIEIARNKLGLNNWISAGK